jgi:hypothetical protein
MRTAATPFRIRGIAAPSVGTNAVDFRLEAQIVKVARAVLLSSPRSGGRR